MEEGDGSLQVVHASRCIVSVRRLAGIAVIIAINTIAICLITALILDHSPHVNEDDPNSRQIAPHISQTGMYLPENVIFGAGLSIAAILFTFTLFGLRWHMKNKLSINLQKFATISFSAGIAACLGLILLADVSLSVQPFIHGAFAFSFFFSIIFFAIIDTYIWGKVYREPSMLIWLKWKRVCIGFLAICFVVQIGMGGVIFFVAGGSVINGGSTGNLDSDSVYLFATISAVDQYCMILTIFLYLGSFWKELEGVAFSGLSLVYTYNHVDRDNNADQVI